jgi:hypothetical protein
MLILFGSIAALLVIVSGVAVRVARSAGNDSMGAMSDQWLAEHRASHHRPLGD